MQYRSLGIGALLGALVVAGAWAVFPSTPQEPASAAPTAVRPLAPVTPRPVELSTDELKTLAKHELYAAYDPQAARRMLERLLERDLAVEERTGVLTDLGVAYRNLGEFDASIQALEHAWTLPGQDGDEARAGYQLMWTHKLAGNLHAAVRTGEALVARGPLGGGLGAATHRALGLFAREAGDQTRSRQEFERAIEVAGEDPTLREFSDEIRGWLRSE